MIWDGPRKYSQTRPREQVGSRLKHLIFGRCRAANGERFLTKVSLDALALVLLPVLQANPRMGLQIQRMECQNVEI